MKNRMQLRKLLNKVSTFLKGHKQAGAKKSNLRRYVRSNGKPNSTKFAACSSNNATVIRGNKYSMSHATKLRKQRLEQKMIKQS